MKEERKEILKVQPWYSSIVWIVLSACGGVMLILPNALSWEYSTKLSLVIYYAISMIFIVLGLIYALRFMEYAELYENRVVIKSLFGKIVSLEWNDIKSIKIEDLITYDSRGHIYLSWIVIKSSKCVLGKGRLNKKKNSFCQIVASSKNIAVLKRYANNNNIPFE